MTDEAEPVGEMWTTYGTCLRLSFDLTSDGYSRAGWHVYAAAVIVRQAVDERYRRLSDDLVDALVLAALDSLNRALKLVGEGDEMSAAIGREIDALVDIAGEIGTSG